MNSVSSEKKGCKSEPTKRYMGGGLGRVPNMKLLCPQEPVIINVILIAVCSNTHRIYFTNKDHLSFGVQRFLLGFHFVGVINQIFGHVIELQLYLLLFPGG